MEKRLSSRQEMSKREKLTDPGAWPARDGHNSRRIVDTVVRTCKLRHERWHQTAAMRLNWQTPYDPGKRAQAPSGSSAQFAKADMVKRPCPRVLPLEAVLASWCASRRHCSRQIERNQVDLIAFRRSAAPFTCKLFALAPRVIDRSRPVSCSDKRSGSFPSAHGVKETGEKRRAPHRRRSGPPLRFAGDSHHDASLEPP